MYAAIDICIVLLMLWIVIKLVEINRRSSDKDDDNEW